VAKPERQRPLGGNGRRADDNIKIDFKEMEWKFLLRFVCLWIRTNGGLL
jgi:uncharacterized membrane protein